MQASSPQFAATIAGNEMTVDHKELIDLPIALSTVVAVGATTTGVRGGTAASEQATLESFVGHQSIRRCYANQSYKTSPYWLTSFLGAVDVSGGVSLRTTHVSWNPDCSLLASENPSGFDPTHLLQYLTAGSTGTALTNYGTETQANLTWILSCPKYAQNIWTPWHEADINQAFQTGYNYGTNYAMFKLSFGVLADIVHTIVAYTGAPWQICMILTADAWKSSSGTSHSPDNFYPGSAYCDVVGIDAYNEGSVGGTRWDSLQVSLGYPADANEAASYETVYGGTNGYKFVNGFLGWCETRGVAQWVLSEFGTLRNYEALAPSWVGGVGNKEQWIQTGINFIANYNINTSNRAKCIGVEYFMRGRVYTGADYISKAIHLTADGSLQVCVGANTFATLPTSGNTNGDKRWTTDTSHIYQWNSGTSAWVDLGAGLVESWELWWNEDGSGWDGSNSAYPTWAAVGAQITAINASTYSDLSLSTESVTITRAVTTDMPDGTRLLVGYPTATADITLSGQVDPADESKNAAWLFNPYSANSPLYRISALNSPVTAQIGLRDGLTLAERITTFTGFVDEVATDPVAGTATLSCLDWRTKLRGNPTITPIVTGTPYNTGLTSEYALDALLRGGTDQQYSSWPARRPGCVLAVGMRSSLWPDVGSISTVFAQGTPIFEAGEFGTALGGMNIVTGDSLGPLYNLATPIPSSDSGIFIEFWGAPSSPTHGLLSNAATNVQLFDNPLSTNVTVIVSYRTGSTVLQVSVIASGQSSTWSTNTGPTSGIHYIGVQLNWPVGSTTWSATAYIDNQSYSSGPQTVGAPRPTNAIAYGATGFGAQPDPNTGSIEAIQVSTETAGVPNYGFSPKAVLDPSLNSLTAIPDTSGASDAWGVIQDIADAELGFAGFDELGIFRFKNRTTLNATATSRTITSAASLESLQVDQTAASVVNHVQVAVNSLMIAAPSQVWMLANAQEIGPKQTVVIVATLGSSVVGVPLTDSGEAPSGGGTPGLTYWRASYDANGLTRCSSGITATTVLNSATQATVTVTNNNPRTVYLISSAVFTDIAVGTPYLAIGGQLVTPQSVQTLDAQWPPENEGGALSSVYGDILLSINNPWVQNSDVGQDLLDYALEDLSLPRPSLTGVAIVADPRLQLSDRVTIQDPEVTGINDDAIIFGITTTISGADWSQSIDARTVGMPGRWILGDPVKSVLGVSTYP